MVRNNTGTWLRAISLWAAYTPVSTLAQEVIFAASLTNGTSDRGCAFQVPAVSPVGRIEYAVGVGDVDGDSFGDLLISTSDPCNQDDGVLHEAMLVFGRPRMLGKVDLSCDLPRTAIFRAKSQYRMEQGAVNAGDVNHDGLNDFLIGFPYYTGILGDKPGGKAYLVFGSKDLEGSHSVEEIGVNIPGVAFWSSDPEARGIGRVMANIGDFDGDGNDDFAIAAPFSGSNGIEITGTVFIIIKVSDLPSVVDLAQFGVAFPGLQVIGARFPPYSPPSGPLRGESAGYGVSAVGDVDGDGLKDVLLQAWGDYLRDQENVNRHYLLRGNSKPPPLVDLMQIVEGAEIDGVTLFKKPKMRESFRGAAIGDFNEDGHSDMMFGALGHYSPLFGEASWVYLYFGSGSLSPEVQLEELPASARIKFHEVVANSGFGGSIAPAGDMNGDRVLDFIVGAPFADSNGYSKAGESYAIYGQRDFGPEVVLSDGFSGIQLLGEADGSRLGGKVASVGDFDGDGAPDFISIATWPIQDINNDGAWFRAYLVYGTGDRPQPLRLQSIDPAWGPVRGGTTVDLRGTGFQGEPKVYFGKTPAPSIQVVSTARIKVVTPAADAPQYVDVTIEIGGEIRRLDFGFEYTPNFPEIDLDRLGSNGIILTGQLTDNLGRKIAIGDITGDGIDDLVIGSGRGGQILVGLVKGGPGLPENLPAFTPSERVTVISTPPGGGMNYWVSIPGDVDGDGIKDIGIGQIALGDIRPGYILFGGSDLPEEIDLDGAVDSARAVKIDPGRLATEYLMVALGDLTGDGIDDFAVSLRDDGGVIILVAGRSTWGRELHLNDSPQVFSRFHNAITRLSVGDVDGDGFQDLLAFGLSDEPLVGASTLLVYGTDQFPADVDLAGYVRGGGGVNLKLPEYGSGAAAPGDVNGDRYADILIGQPGGGRKTRQGESYLIFGGPKLPAEIEVPENPDAQDGIVRILGEHSEWQTAHCAPAGDFNDDGFRDFLIGDSIPQDPTGDSGNVFLILGAKQLPSPIDLAHLGGRGIRIRSPEFGWIGQVVGPSGDLNGDGQTDFAIGVGARLYPDQESVDESRLYVIFGQYGEKDFIRGDANRDGLLDISDAVTILTYLYLGGEKPTCIDSLDSDDSGLLDVTDAVYLLGFLFLAQPAPPEPFPLEGKDTTQDVLDCLGFNP